METINFLITGVGGQGTVLASDIMAAVGLAAGYDVKKSDILGLAIRGGAVIGHVRWGEVVHSPIVPEGRADFLLAFELLEGLRWLDQLKPEGHLLVNQQEIHPVTVSSGFAQYPAGDVIERSFESATHRVFRIPGLQIARDLGNARVLNVVLLGAASALLPAAADLWHQVLRERVPARYVDLNLQAFENGRRWIENQKVPA
jgi:indolepyruvate ferredoxin oxidoreductase beta subunit